jgi:hypothetical protein
VSAHDGVAALVLRSSATKASGPRVGQRHDTFTGGGGGPSTDFTAWPEARRAAAGRAGCPERGRALGTCTPRPRARARGARHGLARRVVNVQRAAPSGRARGRARRSGGRSLPRKGEARAAARAWPAAAMPSRRPCSPKLAAASCSGRGALRACFPSPPAAAAAAAACCAPRPPPLQHAGRCQRRTPRAGARPARRRRRKQPPAGRGAQSGAARRPRLTQRAGRAPATRNL